MKKEPITDLGIAYFLVRNKSNGEAVALTKVNEIGPKCFPDALHDFFYGRADLSAERISEPEFETFTEMGLVPFIPVGKLLQPTPPDSQVANVINKQK